MPNHTYSISEIVGSSPDGVEAAVNNALSTASKTLRNMDWFEVTEIRGHLEDGKVADWQVGIKLGFRVEG
ncbi:dodecin [Ornithinicoccus halotolerans]|uniref:dodecin n=1 Tax=Ornithinicoccus halotolerans TaxID=1748220 RepID=UPI001296F0E7|nr:dodecin [Ornithinicoccus halotolerans]